MLFETKGEVNIVCELFEIAIGKEIMTQKRLKNTSKAVEKYSHYNNNIFTQMKN